MEKFSAIVLHESTLVSLGLSKILSEMFNIKAACYKVIPKNEILDDCDIIFISTHMFALAHETLLSKKHKCVLIFSGTHDFDAENTINQFWSEERIVNVISNMLGQLSERKNSQGELSKREIDVLKLIVKGFLNKEIADALNISINTVLTHRKNITAKLGIKSVSGLSVYAMMNGYI